MPKTVSVTQLQKASCSLVFLVSAGCLKLFVGGGKSYYSRPVNFRADGT